MSPESLIAFNLVLLAALASPGAAMLFVIKTTVSSGRMTGIMTGLDLGSAAACWTLAAFLGLESLFSLFPWAYTALKIGGALVSAKADKSFRAEIDDAVSIEIPADHCHLFDSKTGARIGD